MDEPLSPERQIGQLRTRLDQLAQWHGAELDRLRTELAELERRVVAMPGSPADLTPSLPPLPPAPDRPEPEPVPAPEPAFKYEPVAKAVEEPEVPVAHAPAPARTSGDWVVRGPESVPIPAVPGEAPSSPPSPSGGSAEFDFGRVWLVRIGIVLLLTGLVLLGNFAYRNWIRDLPAVARLAFLMATAVGISGAGWWCTLRDRLRSFGEVVLAGGMGFFYWCAYASHHVDRLRVIESPGLSTVALLAAAGVIVAVSLRREARTTAVLGLLLASYSTVLQPMGWLSAVSNLVIAGTGVALMRRKGWAGPGAAAMAGSYGAFLWWDLAGASGGGVVPSSLWFLAGIWALFALPGSIRRLAGSLDDYRTAWLTGANNAVFFGLFAFSWLLLEYGDFWRVPAVFGAVLVGLAAAGRRERVSGSTHLVQGLVLLTLALVLKLEGYHLALGLAIEALVMAGAFFRFHKAPELVFSALAAAGAAVLAVIRPDLPVWSGGVIALLLAAAALVVRIGAERAGSLARDARKLATLGVAAATVAGLFGWCLRLPVEGRAVAAEAVALGAGALVLLVDRRRWLPDLRAAALAFGLMAVALVAKEFRELDAMGLFAVAGLATAAAVLWEKRGKPDNGPPWAETLRPLTSWWFALTMPLALGLASVGHGDDVGPAGMVALFSLGGLGLGVAAGRFLRCPKLVFSAELLLLGGLYWMVEAGARDSGWLIQLVPSACALAALRFAGGGGLDVDAGEVKTECLQVGLTRTVACLGWILAWIEISPDYWPEVLALSAAALVFVGRRWLPGRRLPEPWVLGAVALAMFAVSLTAVRWEGHGGLPDGWGLLVAATAVALGESRRVGKGLLWLAAVVVGLWSTRWLVGEAGWKPVAILWSGLGFGLVSVGLWRRMAPWRHAGFAVLALALVKLFTVDVWDFGTFHRVLAFLALGVALVVLGFFYNRFADLLKRMIESDEARELRRDAGRCGPEATPRERRTSWNSLSDPEEWASGIGWARARPQPKGVVMKGYLPHPIVKAVVFWVLTVCILAVTVSGILYAWDAILYEAARRCIWTAFVLASGSVVFLFTNLLFGSMASEWFSPRSFPPPVDPAFAERLRKAKEMSAAETRTQRKAE